MHISASNPRINSMAHIAVLGLGNWGTAIARLWLLEGHHVKGWTIEQEVYESIMMDGVNRKYLPDHSVEGLDVNHAVLKKRWKV